MANDASGSSVARTGKTAARRGAAPGPGDSAGRASRPRRRASAASNIFSGVIAMRCATCILVLCLSAAGGVPWPALGRDPPEVQRLKERVERLQAEQEALKAQLAR